MDAANWNQQMIAGGGSFVMAGRGQGPMSSGVSKGGFSMADQGATAIGGAGQGPGTHQCQLCGSGMNSKRMMLSHLKECSERQMKVLFETNQCLQCRNAFLSRELLLVHINTCAGEQLDQVIQIEAMQAMQAAQAAQIKQEAAAANAAEKQGAEKFPKAEGDDGASSQGDVESTYGAEFEGDDEDKSRQQRKRSYSPMKNEEDDNQYPCNIENCDKSFSSQNILKNHSDTAHLGKSNNQCGLCGKKFTTAHSMKSHDEAVHQGKKNFKCNSCEKSYSYPNVLKDHMESVHQGKRFQCNLCNKSFIRKALLTVHVRVEHQE